MITWGVTALNVAAHWTQNTAQWTRHSCTVCTHNKVYAAQLHSVRMCKAVSHWRGRLPLPNPLTPPKTLKARQSQKDQKPKDIAAAHLTPGSKHFPDQNPQRRGSETETPATYFFSQGRDRHQATTKKRSKLYLYRPQTRVTKADQRKISLPGNSPYKVIKVGWWTWLEYSVCTVYTFSCIKSYSDFMNFPVSNHCDHHHHHHRHHLQQMHMINESMSIVLSGLKVSSGFTSNQPTMVMRSLHGLFAANMTIHGKPS